MSQETHQYTNNEITVIWKPNVCIHTTCCKRLIEVFNPKETLDKDGRLNRKDH